MKGRLELWWKSYKYRFAPWLAWNLKKELVKSEKKLPTAHALKDVLRSEQILVQELITLLTAFERPTVTLLFRDNQSRREHFQELHQRNSEILLKSWGFDLEVRKSRIEGAGNGVFVRRGRVCKGQVASLYPGLVYDPFQPILFQSIGNPYILK